MYNLHFISNKHMFLKIKYKKDSKINIQDAKLAMSSDTNRIIRTQDLVSESLKMSVYYALNFEGYVISI